MDDGPQPARRRVTIVNTYGLHMRPSNRFVKLATSFQSDVLVRFGNTQANGKSILDMTSLAAERGAEIEIEVRGGDALEALEALVVLVAAGFHMDDEAD